MAIEAPQTALNGGIGNYHRIQRIEILASTREPVPKVNVIYDFYVSEAARRERPEFPLFVRGVIMSIPDLVAAGFPDPREMFYEAALKLDPAFAGTNAVGDVSPDGEAPPTTLPGTVAAETAS